MRWLIIPLLVLSFLPGCGPAAPLRKATGDSPPEPFFSIHVASFRSLDNANRHVNNLRVQQKVVFWQETDVPGKGLFHRVYVGRYGSYEEALAVWKRLKEEGAVSYRGIHRFTEPVVMPPLEEVPAPEASGPPAGRPEPTAAGASTPARGPDEAPPVFADRPEPDETPPPPTRFVDNGDGTVTDTRTRLMWVKNGWRLEFVGALTWDEAVRRCRDFRLNGHQDWRLPELDEWRTIIDTGYQFPALVEPNPFDNVIVHQPYWTASTVRRSPVLAYTVLLYHGSVHRQMKRELGFVMPVRSVE